MNIDVVFTSNCEATNFSIIDARLVK